MQDRLAKPNAWIECTQCLFAAWSHVRLCAGKADAGWCADLFLDHGSEEGDFELTWDKQVLVHMDDAMRIPKTSGFLNTVAHHFYEVTRVC